MKLNKLVLAMSAVVASAALTGCGGSSSSSNNDGGSSIGANGSITSKITFSGNQNGCANGGVTVYSGIDKNQNGKLDESERTTTDHICHGADGASGADGTPGTDGKPGKDGAGMATLKRFATAPLGAEFTGMFLTENNFFFNIQHPSIQATKMRVFLLSLSALNLY